MTCRYGDDPPEGAGEAGGAVGGADSAPASFVRPASPLGINIRENTITVVEDPVEKPADDEFVDIFRELDEGSDGKTKKQKSFHLNV